MPDSPEPTPGNPEPTPGSLNILVSIADQTSGTLTEVMRLLERRMMLPPVEAMFHEGPPRSGHDRVIMPNVRNSAVMVPQRAQGWWQQTLRLMNEMNAHNWDHLFESVIYLDLHPDLMRFTNLYESTWDYLALTHIGHVDFEITVHFDGRTTLRGHSYGVRRAVHDPALHDFSLKIDWETQFGDADIYLPDGTRTRRAPGAVRITDFTQDTRNPRRMLENDLAPGVWDRIEREAGYVDPAPNYAYPNFVWQDARIDNVYANGAYEGRGVFQFTFNANVEPANTNVWRIMGMDAGVGTSIGFRVDHPEYEAERRKEYRLARAILNDLPRNNRAARRAKRFSRREEGRHRSTPRDNIRFLSDRRRYSPNDVVGRLQDGELITAGEIVLLSEITPNTVREMLGSIVAGFASFMQAIEQFSFQLQAAMEQLSEANRQAVAAIAGANPVVAIKEMSPDQVARSLLIAHLDPIQEKMYKQYGYFFVLVPTPPGKIDRITGANFWWYRIDSGSRSHNIHEFNPVTGAHMATFCVHPAEPVPQGDVMLAQKLMIEHNHDGFLKTANMSPSNGEIATRYHTDRLIEAARRKHGATIGIDFFWKKRPKMFMRDGKPWPNQPGQPTQSEANEAAEIQERLYGRRQRPPSPYLDVLRTIQ